MSNIINLTPHPINLINGVTFPRSKNVARVTELPFGDVVGLPDPQPDTQYIVSIIVAERLPDRRDLLVPGKQVRDATGRIVGCESLIVPRDSSPVLAELAYRTGAAWVRQMALCGAKRLEVAQKLRGQKGVATAFDEDGEMLGSVRFYDPSEWDPTGLYWCFLDDILDACHPTDIEVVRT